MPVPNLPTWQECHELWSKRRRRQHKSEHPQGPENASQSHSNSNQPPNMASQSQPAMGAAPSGHAKYQWDSSSCSPSRFYFIFLVHVGFCYYFVNRTESNRNRWSFLRFRLRYETRSGYDRCWKCDYWVTMIVFSYFKGNNPSHSGLRFKSTIYDCLFFDFDFDTLGRFNCDAEMHTVIIKVRKKKNA